MSKVKVFSAKPTGQGFTGTSRRYDRSNDRVYFPDGRYNAFSSEKRRQFLKSVKRTVTRVKDHINPFLNTVSDANYNHIVHAVAFHLPDGNEPKGWVDL